jgi:hypothetical protein
MTLMIVLIGVEERPRFLVDSLSETETQRLADWLRSSSVLEELALVAAGLLEELRRAQEPGEAA